MIQKILAQKKFIFTSFTILCLCTFRGCGCEGEATAPNIPPPVGNPTSGYLFTVSYDAGQTWSTPDTLDEMISIVYCGALNGGTGIYLLGGLDTAGVGTIWRSTDNGHTFQSCYILSTSKPKKMYDFSAVIFVINWDGSYLKSSDAGLTWTLTGSGAKAVCMETMSGILLLGTSDGKIMRSLDGGLSWINTYNDSLGNVTDIAASIGTTAIACDLPFILRTTDAGQTWNSVLTTGASFLNVNASLFHDGHGIIVSNVSPDYYTTNDDGQTFQMNNYNVPFEYNDISIVSSTNILAATSKGLKSSNTFGGNWQDLALTDKSIHQINRNGEAAFIFVVGK